MLPQDQNIMKAYEKKSDKEYQRNLSAREWVGSLV